MNLQTVSDRTMSVESEYKDDDDIYPDPEQMIAYNNISSTPSPQSELDDYGKERFLVFDAVYISTDYERRSYIEQLSGTPDHQILLLLLLLFLDPVLPTAPVVSNTMFNHQKYLFNQVSKHNQSDAQCLQSMQYLQLPPKS